MNHRKVHDQIIDRAKSRILEEGIYFERHHVVPRCMGGLDEDSNLVKLTAREHFLVHWLLVEIYKETEYLGKLSHAWNMMCNISKGHECRKVNSRYFSYARECQSKAIRIKLLTNNHLTLNPEVVYKIMKTRKSNYDRDKTLGVDTQYDKGIKVQLNKALSNKILGLPTQWDIGGLKSTDTFINKSRLKWGPVLGKQIKGDGIIYYESPLEAAKELKGHAGTIAQVALGNRNYAYGYTWEFSK
jgi:hypothetical protein